MVENTQPKHKEDVLGEGVVIDLTSTAPAKEGMPTPESEKAKPSEPGPEKPLEPAPEKEGTVSPSAISLSLPTEKDDEHRYLRHEIDAHTARPAYVPTNTLIDESAPVAVKILAVFYYILFGLGIIASLATITLATIALAKPEMFQGIASSWGNIFHLDDLLALAGSFYLKILPVSFVGFVLLGVSVAGVSKLDGNISSDAIAHLAYHHNIRIVPEDGSQRPFKIKFRI